MSQWPASKADRVLRALLRLGWQIKRQSGWPDFVFSFHDREELGPRMLTRLARHTGLSPDDL